LFKIKADPFPYDDRFFFFGIKEIYIYIKEKKKEGKII
jgi:hypothetical protein